MQYDKETENYIKFLEGELQSATNILNEFGVDKDHWSLAGRIERLLVMLQAQQIQIPEYIQETAYLFFKKDK